MPTGSTKHMEYNLWSVTDKARLTYMKHVNVYVFLFNMSCFQFSYRAATSMVVM